MRKTKYLPTPATNYKYAPNLIDGDLILVQGYGLYPAIFIGQTAGSTYYLPVTAWMLKSLTEGGSNKSRMLTWRAQDRLSKYEPSNLSVVDLEIYNKMKKILSDREATEKAKALAKQRKANPYYPGCMVKCCTAKDTNLTKDQEYFVQEVNKKRKEIMIVDNSYMPNWYKMKNFTVIVNEEEIETVKVESVVENA